MKPFLGVRTWHRMAVPIARRGILTYARAKGPSEVRTVQERRDGQHTDTSTMKPPLLEDTVGDHFGKVVSRHGDRNAFVSSDPQLNLMRGSYFPPESYPDIKDRG